MSAAVQEAAERFMPSDSISSPGVTRSPAVSSTVTGSPPRSSRTCQVRGTLLHVFVHLVAGLLHVFVHLEAGLLHVFVHLEDRHALQPRV